MIVGNGMIANVFNERFEVENVIIFASGVSNSKETRPEEFKKELNLVQETILKYPNKLFVYFSTCSIHNNFSHYIEHKINIEKYIIDNSNNYLILRLPIVLGRNQNKNQLIGFLFDKNINNETIEIYKNANRYLIDSNDLPKILEILIEKNITNEIIEIAFNNSIMIDDLLSIIEKITNKRFLKNYSSTESPYFVNNSKFLKIFNGLNENEFNIDIEKMLHDYYKQYL
jgi:nucleoside-diphosphate-sugar epimerase